MLLKKVCKRPQKVCKCPQKVCKRPQKVFGFQKNYFKNDTITIRVLKMIKMYGKNLSKNHEKSKLYINVAPAILNVSVDFNNYTIY